MLPPGKTGIAFENSLAEERVLENQFLLNGSGVALGDVDGDGLADIYFASLDGQNVLYKNLGGWRFQDVTDRAGVAAPDRFSTGAAFADIDGDGDLDLLVTALGGPNALYVNGGDGVFRDATKDAGLESDLGSTTATFADVDGDGDLDLYVASYKTKSVRDMYPPAAILFDRVVKREGDSMVVRSEFAEHYGLARRGNETVRFEFAEPDRFYLNDGSGRFAEVPITSDRFLWHDGNPIEAPLREWGLTARFYDIDRDGDPDLFVCNDFESPDRLWINDGSGRFRLAAPLALRKTSGATMAVDYSDVDRDGDVDFVLLDMRDLTTARQKTQTVLNLPVAPAIGEIEPRPQVPRNTLFLNRGDNTFAEAAYYAGLEASGWSWSALFMDVDLDGYEDLLVTTGYDYDFLDLDTMERIEGSVSGIRNPLISGRRFLLLFPPLDLPNVVFRNNGDLTFEEVGEAWGFGVEEDVSHGMAAADLDGDGDLDVVANRLGKPAAVYRNETNRERLAVRLRGLPPNTQGIGAKVYLRGGPVFEQYKEVTLGAYLSSSEPLVVFAARGEELTIFVEWRSGAWSLVSNAKSGRVYEIDETGQLSPEQLAGVDLPGSGDEAAEPEELFRDVTADLGHIHSEAEYYDRRRQPLLRNRLSQLGPGITWYDVDGDGDEDLLVAAGRGGSLGYYRNEGGHFTPVPVGLPAAGLDQTTVLPIADGSGGVSLLVGQMNYEAAHPSDARQTASVLRADVGRPGPSDRLLRAEVSAAVPGEMSSTGPLALADYDSDGDLDLFVGGRVLPARYPAPASSRLFRNLGGRFALDSTNSRLLSRLGLVSGAVFSDIDADGDPDLLLAVEWGSLRLFVNDGGKFSDATESFGLSEFQSMWNGITTGDLNGDGLPDIVATSWGRNVRMEASRERPFLMYYADFDGNGTMDVVEARYDPRLGAVAPIRHRVALMLGIPFIGRRIDTYHEYADATVQDVLGTSLANASVLRVNTFEHMVFLSRDGGFDPRPLPTEAQLAPSFYAGIADFDGDGHEDLLLSQNFYPTETETARYDAGRALLLLGDGTGNLRALPGHRSGIRVYGDQRGAAFADYDGDGRLDVAISQNGAATKLYRNERGTPGLRVRLIGPPENPHGVGSTLRIVYAERLGPAQEIHAGSGYWSHDGATRVLGVQDEAIGVSVRWPDGSQTETLVQSGEREITIHYRR